MPTDTRLPAAAVEALRQGRTLEAVKIVRESNGLSLKDAHDVVQRHRQQAGASAQGTLADVEHDAPAPEGGFVFPPEAANAIARGNVMEAIGHVRRANPGLDLHTAKAAVDDLRGARPGVKSAMPKAQRIPTVVEGDQGGHRWLVVVVLVVVAAVWWFSSRAA